MTWHYEQTGFLLLSDDETYSNITVRHPSKCRTLYKIEEGTILFATEKSEHLLESYRNVHSKQDVGGFCLVEDGHPSSTTCFRLFYLHRESPAEYKLLSSFLPVNLAFDRFVQIVQNNYDALQMFIHL